MQQSVSSCQLFVGVGYIGECPLVFRHVQVGMPGVLEGLGSDITRFIAQMEVGCFLRGLFLSGRYVYIVWQGLKAYVVVLFGNLGEGFNWEGLYPRSVSLP